MKFFIDTANIHEIKKAWELGLIDGVTTNPSLIAKEDSDPVSLFEEICSIVEGPVNAEVVGLLADDMIREAEALAKLTGINWTELLKDAAKELPDPKAWAKLNEDGTPKTAAKPKPVKQAKKKTSKKAPKLAKAGK